MEKDKVKDSGCCIQYYVSYGIAGQIHKFAQACLDSYSKTD